MTNASEDKTAKTRISKCLPKIMTQSLNFTEPFKTAVTANWAQ